VIVAEVIIKHSFILYFTALRQSCQLVPGL